MSRKKMAAGIVILAVIVIFVVLFFTNNVGGQSFDKKVVGQWSNVPVTGGCDSNLEDGFFIHEDGTIEGIEGFKEYQVEETDSEINYLIVSGGYEDIRRYEVNFNEDDLLMVQEENVSEGLTCYFEKVE